MKKLALVTLTSLLVSTAAYAGDSTAVCHMLSARAAMVGDANAQPMPGMPDMIRVPVSMEMAKQLSAGWPAGTPADGTTLEVHRDGKVMFSGQDVTAPINTWCANAPKEETPTVAEHPHKVWKAKHKAVKAASHKAAKHTEASEPNMPAEAEAPVTQQAVPAPAAMPAMKADDTAAAPAPAPAATPPMAAAPAPATAAPPALQAPVSNNPFATDTPAAATPPSPPAAASPMTVGKPGSDANKPAWPAPNAQ